MSIPWKCTTCGGQIFDDTRTWSAHPCRIPPILPGGIKKAPSFADRLKQNPELVDDLLLTMYRASLTRIDWGWQSPYLRSLIVAWADRVQEIAAEQGQTAAKATPTNDDKTNYSL